MDVLAWAGFPILLVVAAIVCWPKAIWTHLRYASAYPSVGTAAWLSGLFLLCFWCLRPDAFASLLPAHIHLEDVAGFRDRMLNGHFPEWSVALWVCLPVVPFLLKARAHVRGPEKSDLEISKREVTQLLPLGDFASLLKWIADDDAIELPGADLFGHAVVAKRMAGRLSTFLLDPLAAAPNMALVGDLGSGKSTILNLTKRELFARHDAQNCFIVDLSLWQFDTPQAAVRGILDELVRRLRCRVSTLAITGLSSRYVEAVDKLGGFLAALRQFAQPSASPQMLLDQMEAVALAANIRMVLWIEDLERFAGKREGDVLRPVEALLFHLQQRDWIAVVVATTSLSTQIDVQKTLRYVEEVPRLDPEAVYPVLRLFRNEWRANLAKADYIDPVTTRESSWDEVDLPDARAQESIRQAMGSNYHPDTTVRLAASSLCRPPRTLKMALRHCHEVFGALKGEIDFDDVLMIGLLRFSEPRVFALIQDHLPELRTGRTREKDDKRLEPFDKRLHEILADADPNYQLTVNHVINSVFPGRDSAPPSVWRLEKPQGLAVLNEARPDYWTRYIAASAVPPASSDQTLLYSMQAWKMQTHQEEPLGRRVATSKDFQRIEAFSRMFNEDDWISLLECVAREKVVPRDRIAFAWRMVRSHTTEERQYALASVVEKLVHELLQEPAHANFVTAWELVNLFAANPSSKDLLTPEQSGRVMKSYCSLLSMLPDGKLAFCLDGGPEDDLDLCNIAFCLNQRSPLVPGGLDGEIKALHRRLWDEAVTSPAVLLPRIARACVQLQGETENFVFNERAAKVFEIADLRKAFANAPESFRINPVLLAAYQTVRKALLSS